MSENSSEIKGQNQTRKSVIPIKLFHLVPNIQRKEKNKQTWTEPHLVDLKKRNKSGNNNDVEAASSTHPDCILGKLQVFRVHVKIPCS